MIVAFATPVAIPLEALSAEALGVQQRLAEHGWNDDCAHAVRRLANRGVEAGEGIGQEMPEEGIAILRAAYAVRDGLDDAGDVELCEMAALDALHLALLSAVENRQVASTRPLDLVLRGIQNTLGVSQDELLRALGTSPRTFQDWVKRNQIPSREEARLRLLARALNELRFVLRGSAALEWLHEPHPLAGNRTPIQLTDEPARLLELVSATRF